MCEGCHGSRRFRQLLAVSTVGQQRSGLGLDAQREAVARYLNGGNWTILAEFVETESGRNDTRPELTPHLPPLACTACRSSSRRWTG